MLNEVYAVGNIISWVNKTVVMVADNEEITIDVSKVRVPNHFGIIVEEQNVIAIKAKIINDKVVATMIKVLDSVKVDWYTRFFRQH